MKQNGHTTNTHQGETNTSFLLKIRQSIQYEGSGCNQLDKIHRFVVSSPESKGYKYDYTITILSMDKLELGF
jgi:hypothetical protein